MHFPVEPAAPDCFVLVFVRLAAVYRAGSVVGLVDYRIHQKTDEKLLAKIIKETKADLIAVQEIRKLKNFSLIFLVFLLYLVLRSVDFTRRVSPLARSTAMVALFRALKDFLCTFLNPEVRTLFNR